MASPPEESARWTRLTRFRTRKALVAGIALAALLIAGVAVATLTLRSSDELSDAEKRAQTQEELRASLTEPFEDLLQHRAAFFGAERQYLDGMTDAKKSVRTYQRRYSEVRAESKRIETAYAPQFEACRTYYDVQCPNPTYPEYPAVPDVSSSTEKLRAAARRLDQIRADVLTADPPPELKVFYSQLLAAIEALRADATHNADVFTEGVLAGSPATEGEGGAYINETKIKTLRGESALPAIRQMNRAGLKIVKLLGLSVADYDLPGGRDLDTRDHSTAQ